jgi:hypothetical protein
MFQPINKLLYQDGIGSAEVDRQNASAQVSHLKFTYWDLPTATILR